MPRHLKNDRGQMCEVIKFTDSCSGCLEAGEYGGNLHNYKWDQKAQIHIGHGCHECGYTGKRRHVMYIPISEFKTEARSK